MPRGLTSCCNIYTTHTSKITSHLRLILQSDIINDNLPQLVGQYWCDNCRKRYRSESLKPDETISSRQGSNKEQTGGQSTSADTGSQDTKCSFGFFQNEVCSDKTSFIPLKSLGKSETHALFFVSNLWVIEEEEGCVCEKHYESLVGFATRTTESKDKHCVDPFGRHEKRIVKTRPASTLIAVKAQLSNLTIYKGDPICDNCRKLIDEKGNDDNGSSTDASQGQSLSQKSTGLSPSVLKEEVKQFLQPLGVSPLNLGVTDYKTSGKINYLKRKLEEVNDSAKKRICRALDIQESDLQNLYASKESKSTDLDKLTTAIKKKLVTVTDFPSRVQLLTLCPSSWSLHYAAKYFEVSRHTIRTARRILESDGILSKPPPQKGREISENVKGIVRAFYSSDENSRMMPGKKDCVSIGGGKHMQKRLLLCNLQELYQKFKTEYPTIKLGLSIFCSLRPKYCVSAGTSGTHSVCLCTTHQNLKLKLLALRLNQKLKDIIPEIVCATQTRECLLQICRDCPNDDKITQIITNKVREAWPPKDEDEEEPLEESGYFLEEVVQYSEWTSTDRAELITKECTIKELIEILTKSLRKAVRHDFVAGAQSEHVKLAKANLKSNQAIILMDFSMNYTCHVQDATQNYHWSKKSCTVHPAEIYVKGENEIKHKSLCFISDDITHDVAIVQNFQEKIVAYLKENHPSVNEIMYVTDGCGPQYKNCKSFLNLCKHEELYGMKASWCFFATSHGKSPCDGIGGTVKREAFRASLQRPFRDQITNAERLFQWCSTSKLSEKISFYYIPKTDVDRSRADDAKCAKKAITVPGTRSFHHFFPLSSTSVGCKMVSADDEFSLIHSLVEDDFTESDLEESTFIAVLINQKTYIGLVTDVNSSEREVELSLLHPPVPQTIFTWSEELFSFVSPISHVLCSVNVEETDNNMYEISPAELAKLKKLASIRKKYLQLS